MSKQTERFNQNQLKKDQPDIRSGDTVRVHQRIKEGDKERIQVFEGLVIAKKHGKGISATVTVRKVTSGVGVERIFPIHSSTISKIEIVKKGKPRQSKLYYLRTAKGKRARLKGERVTEAIVTPGSIEIMEDDVKKPVEKTQMQESKQL